MITLIGLGNPGREYEKNRHNVGFMFIDVLANIYGFALQEKSDLHLYSGKISNKQVILLKPQSYMNNSGIPINKIINFYKIKASDIFVFYDDIEVPFGQIKYKIGGSDAGHNGIRSLNSNIGKEYNKVRIGVGRPTGNKDVAGFVLSNFTKKEQEEIDIILANTADKIELIINHNF